MKIKARKISMCSIIIKKKITPVTIIKTENYINLKKINIISKAKGRGFLGVIKKHNFSSNRKTHGNSKAHNKPGSIGMCQDPGKVFKGKKMAGRKKRFFITIKKIEVIKTEKKNNLMYLYGSIPGKKMSNLYIIT
ncbi:50S ribosomal protein L3 [Candidatus Vidania fulgoroideorum]